MAIRKYTLRKDPVDHRDYVFRSVSIVDHAMLPLSVDLRDQMPPVVDQGELGSCTSNALVSGLREFWLLKSGDQTRLSRLFHYWHERELQGTVDEDSGSTLRDGMRVLKSIGVCPEPDYPYDITKFTEKPSDQAEKDAPPYRIQAYHRVPNLTALKVALAEGNPVAMGIVVFESFESQRVADTGIVPMPWFWEQELGGHAILAVGYDDDNQWIIFRNSWGDAWGDGGYGYLPYRYVQKYASDMWTGQ